MRKPTTAQQNNNYSRNKKTNQLGTDTGACAHGKRAGKDGGQR